MHFTVSFARESYIETSLVPKSPWWNALGSEQSNQLLPLHLVLSPTHLPVQPSFLPVKFMVHSLASFKWKDATVCVGGRNKYYVNDLLNAKGNQISLCYTCTATNCFTKKSKIIQYIVTYIYSVVNILFSCQILHKTIYRVNILC